MSMERNASRDRSRLDGIGAFILGLYFTMLFTAPVYGAFFDGSILVEPKYALAVLLTATVGAVVAATVLRPRLRAYIYEASVWNEVILYAGTFVLAVIGTALALVVVNVAITGEPEVPLVMHHVLATVVTVVTLILRRRGRVTYPDWIQANSWGLQDYMALFGGVFLLTYTYMSSAFGPTNGPLSLLSVLCAVAAVLLRRAGVFVLKPHPGNPSQ